MIYCSLAGVVSGTLIGCILAWKRLRMHPRRVPATAITVILVAATGYLGFGLSFFLAAWPLAIVFQDGQHQDGWMVIPTAIIVLVSGCVLMISIVASAS